MSGRRSHHHHKRNSSQCSGKSHHNPKDKIVHPPDDIQLREGFTAALSQGARNVEVEVERLMECTKAFAEKEKFKLKQYYEEEMVRKNKSIIQEFKSAMESEVIEPLKHRLCECERENQRLREEAGQAQQRARSSAGDAARVPQLEMQLKAAREELEKALADKAFSPGVATTVPGVPAPVPDFAEPVPGVAAPVPGVATAVPGVAATVPDFAEPVPGVAATVPGVAAPVPGVAATVPGVAATVPGVAATVPGVAATVPGVGATANPE